MICQSSQLIGHRLQLYELMGSRVGEGELEQAGDSLKLFELVFADVMGLGGHGQHAVETAADNHRYPRPTNHFRPSQLVTDVGPGALGRERPAHRRHRCNDSRKIGVLSEREVVKSEFSRMLDADLAALDEIVMSTLKRTLGR